MLNKKYLILLCCCFYQFAFSQIGNYSKVKKIYRDTYNFLDSANIRGKQYKDKSLYIAYSDRDENNSYLDE